MLDFRLSSVKIGVSILLLMPIFAWIIYYLKGKQFALRDRLKKADAIVVVAGTRRNIKFLNGKILTGVKLYQEGWAPYIVFSGRFSEKVTRTPKLISLEDLQLAANHGRIQTKDVEPASESWDEGLGAIYMRDQAIRMGIPLESILVENEALHTRENAEFTAKILKENGIGSIILVTSPFHQKRTYLSFAKVLQGEEIEIINYYADTDEWNLFTWFLTSEHRKLVKSEMKRIKQYRKKGDIL